MIKSTSHWQFLIHGSRNQFADVSQRLLQCWASGPSSFCHGWQFSRSMHALNSSWKMTVHFAAHVSQAAPSPNLRVFATCPACLACLLAERRLLRRSNCSGVRLRGGSPAALAARFRSRLAVILSVTPAGGGPGKSSIFGFAMVRTACCRRLTPDSSRCTSSEHTTPTTATRSETTFIANAKQTGKGR